MRYSKFFGKTLHGKVAGSELISHQLLLKGGFIAESVAGRYYFLPLGWRVHNKIKEIIKQEMDDTGALEMITPTLHPIEFWAETNRTATTGFELMKVKDRREAEFALGGTAEEMFVDLVRNMHLSYRDLPFNIYQFSTKFRDEIRARGGLLRVREFVMKDAYSFHKDEEDFKKEYNLMAETYSKIFTRMGLVSKKVLADNGYIGGEYCHEYQVETPIGEGRFFESEDGEYLAHEDVAKFERDEINLTDKILDFEIIKQPKWIKTMDDVEKHYKLPKSRFLKNVVYKNTISGEIIIAVIRGDLEVNKTKLEKILDAVGQLEPAKDEDLEKIGTKHGYVHSWGHKAKYVGDISLKTVHNFIGGEKEDETDSINVNYGRDFTCEIEADFAMAYDGVVFEGRKLIEKRGVEVGNIFQLGLHYSTRMKGANFVDNDGKEKPYYMGCYGIGLGRTMATVVEKYNDEKGIIWPKSIAPFDVHFLAIGRQDAVYEEAEKIYASLEKNGIEVLYDDRREKKVSPGTKFADADLIGIPFQIIISEKLLAEKMVEIIERGSGKKEKIAFDQILNFIK
jgi:prolyl-tRNA synthetase